MNLAKLVADNRARILLSQKDKNMFVKLTEQINTIDSTNLNDIKWVGEATIRILLENGVNSQEKLISLWEEWIKALKLNFISGRALKAFIKKASL